MNDALDGLRSLDPPPGGLDRLRQRLARRARRRAAVRVGAAALLVAAAGVAVRTALAPPPVPEWAAHDLIAVDLGLVEPPSEAVSVAPALRDRMAVLRVPTDDARVVLYLAGRR